MQAIAYYEAALKQGGQQFLRSDGFWFLCCILIFYIIFFILNFIYLVGDQEGCLVEQNNRTVKYNHYC